MHIDVVAFVLSGDHCEACLLLQPTTIEDDVKPESGCTGRVPPVNESAECVSGGRTYYNRWCLAATHSSSVVSVARTNVSTSSPPVKHANESRSGQSAARSAPRSAPPSSGRATSKWSASICVNWHGSHLGVYEPAHKLLTTLHEVGVTSHETLPAWAEAARTLATHASHNRMWHDDARPPVTTHPDELISRELGGAQRVRAVVVHHLNQIDACHHRIDTWQFQHATRCSHVTQISPLAG